MSTSITGFRFASSLTAFDAARLLRETLGAVALDYDLARIVEEAVRDADAADAAGKVREVDPLGRAWKDHRADRSAGDAPGVGRCSTWLGDDPADLTSAVYLVINAPREFTAALDAVPWVEEFSYSNASDWTPEGQTWEERSAREEVWGRIMATGVPAQHMLEVTVRDPFDLALSATMTEHADHVDRLVSLAPSTARRAHDVTFALLWEALRAGDDHQDITGRHMGRFFFDQPKAVTAAVAEVLDPDLPRAVVLGDLTTSPAPDLTRARALAAAWVAAGMPEDD